MSATITQIRAGLVTRLATITGLRTFAVWPDTVNTPAAIVRPTQGQYHEAMGSPGYSMISFEVILAIAATGKGLARGQALVDPYLDDSGTKSVKAAIEGDVTLGGIVQTLIVTGWGSYDSIAIGEIEYLGATVRVDVWL